MLGTALVQEFNQTPLPANRIPIIIPTDLPELNVTQPKIIDKIISLHPTIIIHLAAYTNVDGCESNPELCYSTNSMGTKNIAEACKMLNIPMLLVSTDYVFDGTKPIPYIEWDTPNPINIYGQTKLEAELWVKRLVKNYWIVRTSGLYGSKGKNFVNTIIQKLKEGEELRIVNDQIGSPTYTKDLAQAIATLIRANEFGTFHITNSGWVSWFDFGSYIANLIQIPNKLKSIDSTELNRLSKRPKNWRLLNFMWQSVDKPLRTWQEAIDEYIGNHRPKH